MRMASPGAPAACGPPPVRAARPRLLAGLLVLPVKATEAVPIILRKPVRRTILCSSGWWLCGSL